MLEVAFRVEDLYQNWPPDWGPLDDESIAVLTPYTLQVRRTRMKIDPLILKTLKVIHT